MFLLVSLLLSSAKPVCVFSVNPGDYPVRRAEFQCSGQFEMREVRTWRGGAQLHPSSPRCRVSRAGLRPALPSTAPAPPPRPFSPRYAAPAAVQGGALAGRGPLREGPCFLLWVSGPGFFAFFPVC